MRGEARLPTARNERASRGPVTGGKKAPDNEENVMRTLLFAAALSVGGMALAQEPAPAPAPEADAVQTPVSPSGPGTDPNGPNNPPGDGVTQQGTDPNGS